MNTKLDCTVILLSYNSSKVTDICLSKLEKAVNFCQNSLKNSIKVVVVDNGSKDSSVQMIKSKYPFVNLIALKENIGYAAGNNFAMKNIETPYFLLMNSDTHIEKDSIEKSIRILENQKNCDILVSRWVTADGVFHNYGGYLPTPLRIILWSFGFESIPVIKSFIHKIYSYNDDFYQKGGLMEWCPPCFMLLKKEVYQMTKGFDENLWFHMVDAEWCKRIQKVGLKIYFTPKVTVTHLGGASSKGLEASLMMDNFKGLIHYCRKHYPENVKEIIFFVKLGLNARSFIYGLIGKKDLQNIYKSIIRMQF